MGYALVRACLNRGAEVTLVSGPTHLSLKAWQAFCPLNVVDVVSSADMCNATTKAFTQADIAILCAAVADFTPCHTADKKIKKQELSIGNSQLSIELKTTTDIAATLGASKQAHQRLIGFALETHDEHANAERKLQTKNLDMIVLNSLQDKGAGFGVDTNKVTLLYANGTKKDLPLLLKQEVADTIIDSI
jgi:phosphopantothenoylcysteine decarboxylase/phosphopantothenate--cysteine ligase